MRTFVVLVLVCIATWAWAHDWYPIDCCSGRDCSPIDSVRVRVIAGGYVVDEQFYVEFKKALVSPDIQYHACFPSRGKQMGCFWAPRGTT